MQTALLISNVTLDDETGRGANFAARAELLEDQGWRTVVGHVPPPYGRTFLPSLLRCWRLARRKDVDVVTSVSNPFHLQLVGFLVALLAQLPWMAEVRDPMVENPDREPGTLSTRLASLVERLMVRQTDLIVWGNGIQMEDDYFETKYDLDPKKVRKLPFKGFRHDQFSAADTAEFEDFTITYAGSFYDGWIEPFSFYEGLAKYVDQNGGSEAVDITAQFYGDWRPEYDEAIAAAQLGDFVENHDYVPKSELIPVLKGSDALLYIGGDDPANSLNIPSKVYDYVGAKAPILALCPEDFRVAELVRDHDLGTVAPYDDPSGIADAIERLQSGDGFHPEGSVYDLFNRERKVEALASAYDEVASGHVGA